ncbi:MAG: SDR family NAD(P)-dependent oxidoreductase [Rickettsiales bacterium]|jgi:NAD(P)-dependent dehydrogenase (short-subunit alcohol dehydrogenase family)|nr:SDR family NAD(P)-dependent oxidoreductase [Rickettsiales bacterium]
MDKETVFFITGCSSGFGKEIALECLRRGYRVAATARRIEDLDYLAGDPSALCLSCDVTKPETIAAAAKKADENFGSIDVLINNAGVQYSCDLDDFESDKAHRQVETNLFGPVYAGRELLPFLQKSKNGAIVNIASMSGIWGSDGAMFYGMTKAALDNFTLTLRNYFARRGYALRAMSVNPGVFRTDFRKKSLGRFFNYDKEYPHPGIVAVEILNCLETRKELPFRLVLGPDSLERYELVMARMRSDYELARTIAINARPRKKFRSFWRRPRRPEF